MLSTEYSDSGMGLVPLVSESRIIEKRPSGRPRAGMLDRVKDGYPYVAGADPGEVKWVNFHPPPPPFF